MPVAWKSLGLEQKPLRLLEREVALEPALQPLRLLERELEPARLLALEPMPELLLAQLPPMILRPQPWPLLISLLPL